MKKVLEVQGLHVEIPLATGVLHAVRDVSFSVERGQTFCLVGESGCGKSLTALAIMDLLPPRARRSAESLNLEGRDLSKCRERQMSEIRGNKMSMIFQEPMTSLNPCYTIGNQLEEVLLHHKKVSRREAKERAVFLLDKVGITAATSRLKQYPHQLSGGLRQRMMIAMALMCGPSLIIADEPTTALDVTIQAQILFLLASLQRELETGLILITHDLGIVARVADRVAVMYCGQVVETGEVTELFENPLHPYTQGLLVCIPVPGRTKPGEHLGSIPGLVPTPIGDLKGCTFRNRCRYAFMDCAKQDVKLREISQSRAYRCLLSPEVCAQNAIKAEST
ncbi:MAG: ABC transporter ATP-binding protein [Deltaproteobacteria bacterium]|nr:ABC transporter ATP-binding protein [Deltaproteobacteria bacterium]MBW2306169.1 ABC transporter ATP-binding protein [Deltaproteobacteria bacterium]